MLLPNTKIIPYSKPHVRKNKIEFKLKDYKEII